MPTKDFARNTRNKRARTTSASGAAPPSVATLPDAQAFGGPVSARQSRDILRAALDKAKLAEKSRELIPSAEFRDRLTATFDLWFALSLAR